MEKNNTMIGVLLAIGAIVVTGGLVWLAGGGSYELQVMDPVIGEENAPVTIEEFSDFQCPACAANAPIVKEVLKEFPSQVRLVYRDFPLSIHRFARGAASAALCAAQQGQFQEYHDALFESQQVWANENEANADEVFFVATAQNLGLNMEEWEQCRTSRDARKAVQNDVDEGFERGVSATPTFYLNGEQIAETPASVFGWISLIEAELESQGLEPENQQSDGGEESDEMVE
jgi:protein-disulfide isomerase